MVSLDLKVANRERTRLHSFQFSLRDQASNWLERLTVGSISTWEDLTTQFLAQLFPPGRTAKLQNDILMFQQHQESWNDPRDFAKPVKAISLPQDVPSTSDRRLTELENQVQRLLEARLAPKPSVQVNKITSLCEIRSGLHDTQYCLENLEQAFVNYASSRNNKVGGKQFTTSQGPRNFNEATNAWKDKPDFIWAQTQTFTNPQDGSFSTYSSSYQTKFERVLSVTPCLRRKHEA
ncbi:MAK10-like protein [Tanacetum coccineum]